MALVDEGYGLTMLGSKDIVGREISLGEML